MSQTTWFRHTAPERSRATSGAAFPTPLLALLSVAAIMSGLAVAAAAPPSAEVFGALPAATGVVMTPNGQRLAWVDQSSAPPRVIMFDIAAHKELRVLATPERSKVRGIFWNDDETLIIRFTEMQGGDLPNERSREYTINMAYDASGGEGRLLPPSQGNHFNPLSAAVASIVRVRLSKPHTIIMMSRLCRCLMEVDTNTGAETIIKHGAEHTVGWAVDPGGVPLAREDWDWKLRAYRIYALSGDNVRQILRTDDAEPPVFAGILADSSALVLLKPNERGYQAAWALPLDGSPTRLLAEEPDADITNAFEDGYTGAITGVYVSGAKTRIDWLDPAARQRAEVLEHSFPNKEVDIYGWSVDGSRTLAEVQSGSSPPIDYLIDFSTHRADIAAEPYPALENVPLGELKQVTYKARDGTSILAYLTLPPGKAAGTVPLVLLPHGGPQSRDYPTFNWLVQFLATRGYAVLQPQFRGSIGFGEAFEKAGYRQWGSLMQDDLTDGVQAMIAQGIADPHHVAIVGFGYGGYAALAGAAFTPTLYSCAASVYGISDLRAFAQASVPTTVGFGRLISSSESGFKERVGSVSDSAMRTKSPINSVEAIRIPILVASAAGPVPDQQSQRMIEALNKAGKPVTVVNLSPEGMLSAEARVQLLKALESFLHDHI
jgi:dipeptidyl aminopeptidase/acylaminoacyl peptidase